MSAEPPRWIRLLLRLHPPEFRARYAAGVHEMLAARAAEAAVRGRRARVRFALRESAGLIAAALREWLRRARGGGVARGVVRELPLAARRLRRTPGFSLAAIGMLALGVGSTMAVYTLLHRVVLRPLPYEAPDRLVWLDHRAPGLDLDFGIGITTWLAAHYAESSRLLEDVALAHVSAVTLVDAQATAEQVPFALTTVSAAPMLGVKPLLGRWFEPGADPEAVVLSEAFWRRRFGADPGVIGRVVRLGDASAQVIGVMPARFAFPDASIQLWMAGEFPISYPDRGFNYVAVGRMRAGATLAALRPELQGLVESAPDAPGAPAGAAGIVTEGRVRAEPVSLADHVVGNLRATLWVLLGSVLVLLATAWANVANLFLVRADDRRREVAIRRALGAGRAAVARFHLAEALLIGLAAGLAGLALAWSIVRFVAGFSTLHLPRPEEIAVDVHIALVALGLSVVSGLLLTLLPLLRRDAAPDTSLRDGGRSATAGRQRLRLRAGLMAGQLALAMTLLAGAGLLVRSWDHVRGLDPGFAAQDLLFIELALPRSGYTTREAQSAFFDRVTGRVKALPGVRAATVTTCPPLDGYCHGESVHREHAIGGPEQHAPIVSMRRVSHDYFDALELPIVAGRAFTAQERSARLDVVVLGQETARRLFPDMDPVGRRIAPGGAGADAQWFTVVGVAADAATTTVLEDAPEAVLYLPVRDSRDDPRTVGIEWATLIVGAGADPAALVPALRAIVNELDPAVAPSRIRTLQQVLAEDRATLSFATLLLVFAGAMGLALSALGVYAVFAYAIGRRTAEFGVRLALGARAADIARIVIRQAAPITLAGLGAGILGALASTRLLGSLLFGVTPLDPAVYGAAILLLLAVATLALALPTARATRLHPVQALRAE